MSTTRRAPARRRVLARLARASVAARALALGRGSVASISSRSVSRAKSIRSSVGRVVGAVGHAAGAVGELDRVGWR